MSRRRLKRVTYMSLAKRISKLSTCDRKNVGAVVISNDRIISMGFNGAPSGMPHCDDIGHEMVDGHCVNTLHAEENAILHADREELSGASLYVTCRPCVKCMNQIISSGIERVYFDEEYRGDTFDLVARRARQGSVDLVHLELKADDEEKT